MAEIQGRMVVSSSEGWQGMPAGAVSQLCSQPPGGLPLLGLSPTCQAPRISLLAQRVDAAEGDILAGGQVGATTR